MGKMVMSLGIALMIVAAPVQADVIADTMGDTAFESVYSGYTGSGENLVRELSEYVNPATGQSMPIVGTTGDPLNVGDVGLGQDPAFSDQTQFQRFHVTGGDAALELEYLGVGHAGYRSIFGVYTYADHDSPADATITRTPLFVQNVDAPGVRLPFTVPENHYFGFYLDANGHRHSKGMYYTENFRNADNTPDHTTDHFLMMHSNQGLLMAMEDLAYNQRTGLMGDQDFEDMLVGGLTFRDGTPFNPPAEVPEPASLGLAMLGVILIARRGPRRA